MDEHLTDEQQAEVVKKWLRDNGSFLLGGLVLGLGGLFGLNQWRAYQAADAEQASALYENIIGAVLADRSTSADQYITTLEESHADSPYLDQARLLLAKSHLDRNEFEVAASYLAQIVAQSRSDEMVHIARLRLARVRLHQQQYDASLEVLTNSDSASAFAPRYHEVRGDVYLAMNRPNDARLEYQSALGEPEQSVAVDRVYLQAKLDALGGAVSLESNAVTTEPPVPDAAEADESAAAD